MGGSDSGTRASVQALVLAALTVTLFAAAGYVPVVGIPVSLLAPTPLLLVTLRHGLKKALLALGLSSLSLALLFGSFPSLLFLAEYGVMAMTMGETVRRRWSVERTLAIATIAPLVASGIVMGVSLAAADPDVNSLWQQFQENLRQALQPYVAEADRAIEGDLQAYIQEAIGFVVHLLPALFIISTAVGAVLNYGVVRVLWRRLDGPPLFPEVSLAQWKAPEPCVWVLIVGGILYLMPILCLQIAGLNVLLLAGLIYLIQGLGIVLFYLQKATVPPLFRSLAYVVLALQPVLLLGVAAFGLFDLWFDFRRMRNKREESQ
jgi:uncharacterized protein YybS (DUF2232 family)